MITNNVLFKIKHTYLFLSLALLLTFCYNGDVKNQDQIELISKKSITLLNIYEPEICAASDKLFIANSFTSTDGNILVYDYYGNFIKEFGSKGKGPGEFSLISGIFYDEVMNRLGVYDAYNYKIEFFDHDFDHVNSEKLSYVYLKIIPTLKHYLFYYITTIPNNSSDYWHLIIEIRNNEERKIIKKKKMKSVEASYIYKNTLKLGASSKNIFIWDIQEDNFFIEQYDLNGNLKKIWDLNVGREKTKKIFRYDDILVGSDFIMLSFSDENDLLFYELYDFSEQYLGTIEMKSEHDKIGYIYNDFLFYLEHIKNKEDEYYICHISKVDIK